MIVHEKKCIFVRIPKTATWSMVEKLVDGTGKTAIRTHTPVSILKQIYGDVFNEYTKIAVVRNPWDRLVSSFFYIKAGGIMHDDLLKKQSWVDPVAGSFERFVKELLPKGIDSFYNPNVLLPLHHWLDLQLEQSVNILARYENLDADWRRICSALGLRESRLRRLNQSNHEHYKSYYDREMIDIVAEFYKSDIERFAYDY